MTSDPFITPPTFGINDDCLAQVIVGTSLCRHEAFLEARAAGITPDILNGPSGRLYGALSAYYDTRTDNAFEIADFFAYLQDRYDGQELSDLVQIIARIEEWEVTTFSFKESIRRKMLLYRESIQGAVITEAARRYQKGQTPEEVAAWMRTEFERAETIGARSRDIDEMVTQAEAKIQADLTGQQSSTVAWGVGGLDPLTSIGMTESVIIAARPSIGKSSFARQNIIGWLDNMHKRTVLLVTLEMDAAEVLAAMAYTMSGFNPHSDRNDDKAKDSLRQWWKVLRRWIREERLIIRDVTFSSALLDIEAEVRRIGRESPLHAVVIDYLQLIETPHLYKVSGEERISTISRTLKLMAGRIKAPIITLAQLNRESAKNERAPQLVDLRGSGSIEQDANRVLFLHGDKEEAKNRNVTEVSVQLIQAKCRAGPTRAITGRFFKAQTVFDFRQLEKRPDLRGME